MFDSLKHNWIALHTNILLATLLSAVIHAVSTYAYWLYQHSHENVSEKSVEQPLKISFTTVTARPERAIEQPNKSIKENSPSETALEPVVKEIAKPEPQPEVIQSRPVQPKIVKRDITPEPVKKKQKTETKSKPSKPDPESKIVQIEKVQQDSSAPTPVIVVKDTPSSVEIEELYITRLLNKIEKNKFYPRKARRRNIEGTVKVALSINADGKIAKLSLTEGHKILRKAAEKAVKRSLPLPVPPQSLISPKTVSFDVSYRFKSE